MKIEEEGLVVFRHNRWLRSGAVIQTFNGFPSHSSPQEGFVDVDSEAGRDRGQLRSCEPDVSDWFGLF